MERSNNSQAIRITRFVFMESLEPEEFHTGTHLASYVNSLASEALWPISIDQYSAPGLDAFRQALDHLLRQTKSGELPWLHIDAHGSDDYGLHFADGTAMSWSEFCTRLAPINEATRFRLFVFVSTCFGAAIVSGISTSSAAPCVALIGPTEVVDPGELFNRCMTFYRAIVVHQDVTTAFNAAASDKLQSGSLAVVTAEHWWRELVLKAVVQGTNFGRIDAVALREYKRQQDIGLQPDLEKLKFIYWERLPSTLTGFFEAYFMIKALPENAIRFALLKNELIQTLREFYSQAGITFPVIGDPDAVALPKG